MFGFLLQNFLHGKLLFYKSMVGSQIFEYTSSVSQLSKVSKTLPSLFCYIQLLTCSQCVFYKIIAWFTLSPYAISLVFVYYDLFYYSRCLKDIFFYLPPTFLLAAATFEAFLFMKRKKKTARFFYVKPSGFDTILT